MNQRTHSWIAIRAIALLEDESKGAQLVSLLKPFAKIASVGAWIPDETDAKRGDAGSRTENHVFKIEPYKDGQVDRFTTKKAELLEQLGPSRMTTDFLQRDNCLDEAWWGSPYKADPVKPGQHLPNRIMALSTMLKDLLLLGDEEVDALLPGSVSFVKDMAPELRTREQAAAMYFFMLSHFVADACMPCHCDARKLSTYDQGLHKELEAHWSKKVGTGFEKENLLKTKADSTAILQQAKEIDGEFGLEFKAEPVPSLHTGHDPWLEAVFLTRAAFAIASIIAPYQTYPYGSDTQAPFDKVLGKGKEPLLFELDRVTLHDAVLNTAILWKEVWNKVSKKPNNQ